MTSRAALLARVHGIDANGTVWASLDGKHWPVYNVNHLTPEYANLLSAAPLMLRAIDHALPMLDTVQRVFESYNLDAHVAPLMQLEAGLNVAMKAALEGMRKAAK